MNRNIEAKELQHFFMNKMNAEGLS